MTDLFKSAQEVIDAINQEQESFKAMILKDLLMLPRVRQEIGIYELLDIEAESIPTTEPRSQALYSMSDEEFFNHYLDYYHGDINLEDLFDPTEDDESDDIDRLIEEQDLFDENEA